jgi:rhodanese-related sulfurtransferase
MSKSVTFVEPQKLRELLERRERIVILDVRTAEEFAAGHVTGAINIPADQLAARAGEIARDATLVTVCNFGGSRSCNAAEQLRAMGYENVAPLRGGTRGWLGDGETDREEPH